MFHQLEREKVLIGARHGFWVVHEVKRISTFYFDNGHQLFPKSSPDFRDGLEGPAFFVHAAFLTTEPKNRDNS